MIKDVIIKKLNQNIDRRGWLTEIWRGDELDYRPAMSYISLTKPGVVRGPHEHVRQTDCFVFLGPGSFKLYLWDNRDKSKTKGEKMKIEAGENNPTMILIPPGVVHGYKCVSQTAGYCINLADRLYRGEGKQEEADEIRWEDLADSPYRIE